MSNGVTPLILAGQVNKPNPGPVQVNFFQPFERTPIVVLTSVFLMQTFPVTNIETLIEITPEGFTFTSPNAAPNYFVNWVAVSQAV